MTAAALALLALAVVLAVSGATKLPVRQTTEDAFEALRIPVVPRGLGAAVLPWAEIALAVGLLVLRGTPLVAVAVVALLLCLAYTAVIARALTFSEPVTCSCFGRFGAAKVSRTTLWRNIALSGVAVVALVSALGGGSVWWLLTQQLPWVAVAALVVALFALVASGSGAATTHAPAAAGSARHQDEPATGGADTGVVGESELDYQRMPIPYGQLRSSDGEQLVTLRQLAQTQARLLVFLSGTCGACRRTGEQLDAWQAELDPFVGIVPVYSYEPAQVDFSMPWYLQPDGNVSQVLESYGTPSAVLLGADGMLAGGPVAGEDSIRRFVEDVVEQLREGQAMAEAPDPVGSEASAS